MASGRRRRVRLDAELARRGLADSRTAAQRLIGAGRVTVEGASATKPATLVTRGQAIAVADPSPRWASRGGYKLDGALRDLRVGVEGRACLDAGASTGGFTDVLLQHGAARVVAVDVGYGQLDWRLRNDARVVVRERTNVRYLDADDLPPPPPSLVVADLSFISLRLVLPALARVAAPAAEHLLLVKPQFEAGAGRVGAGGVVRDPRVWRDALEGVVEAGGALGLGLAGATVSPLPGPSGNVEFFVHLTRGGRDGDGADRVGAGVAAILDGVVEAGGILARQTAPPSGRAPTVP